MITPPSSFQLGVADAVSQLDEILETVPKGFHDTGVIRELLPEGSARELTQRVGSVMEGVNSVLYGTPKGPAVAAIRQDIAHAGVAELDFGALSALRVAQSGTPEIRYSGGQRAFAPELSARDVRTSLETARSMFRIAADAS